MGRGAHDSHPGLPGRAAWTPKPIALVTSVASLTVPTKKRDLALARRDTPCARHCPRRLRAESRGCPTLRKTTRGRWTRQRTTPSEWHAKDRWCTTGRPTGACRSRVADRGGPTRRENARPPEAASPTQCGPSSRARQLWRRPRTLRGHATQPGAYPCGLREPRRSPCAEGCAPSARAIVRIVTPRACTWSVCATTCAHPKITGAGGGMLKCEP